MTTFGLTPREVDALHAEYERREGPVPQEWFDHESSLHYVSQLRKWARLNNIDPKGVVKMNVKELHEALGKMVEAGHGEADVAHVNGTGKTTSICGWELVTASSYEPRRGAAQQPEKKVLKFHTTARF